MGEEDLTLKIARFCKAELEKYQGVTVYMTRTSGACPYPGTTSLDDNIKRTEYAAKVGADFYISLHLNSGPASAQGVEVYYPNANYNPSVGAEGKDMAKKVLDELVKLGLADRGTKLNADDQGNVYPDGSQADDYTVIKRNKLNGIPAIIVEHAFLSNSSDVNNFLNTDEKLKKLGVADATAIAKYFSLERKTQYNPNNVIMQCNSDASGSNYTISAKGMAGAYSAKVAVWSEKNGQDRSDLVYCFQGCFGNR